MVVLFGLAEWLEVRTPGVSPVEHCICTDPDMLGAAAANFVLSTKGRIRRNSIFMLMC